MSASFLSAMNTRAEDAAEYFDADELCEECTDDNRCEECTHCARTKVCPDCECVGGCYWHCINIADELCEFCGDTDDCLMMCEGCKKSGCSECVKSYIGEYFGDCKECCEKAGSPDGNGWEEEDCEPAEEDSDEEEEPICCVGCGKDGKFPENRDGDTMCESCMSDDDEERKCCMCYIDVRDITFWGCDYCGLNVCETCAINDDGIIHCGNFDCK